MSQKDTKYARVENGQVVEGPQALPQIYQGMENFPNLPDHTLATFGWYPVWYACPECTQALVNQFDAEAKVVRVVVDSDVIGQAKIDAIAVIAKQVSEALQEPFELADLTHQNLTYYYLTDIDSLVSWSLAVTNPNGGAIPCYHQDGTSLMLPHTQEQARTLSAAYGTVREAIMQNKMTRTEAVENTFDLTEIDTIISQGVVID